MTLEELFLQVQLMLDSTKTIQSMNLPAASGRGIVSFTRKVPIVQPYAIFYTVSQRLAL